MTNHACFLIGILMGWQLKDCVLVGNIGRPFVQRSIIVGCQSTSESDINYFISMQWIRKLLSASKYILATQFPILCRGYNIIFNNIFANKTSTDWLIIKLNFLLIYSPLFENVTYLAKPLHLSYSDLWEKIELTWKHNVLWVAMTLIQTKSYGHRI